MSIGNLKKIQVTLPPSINTKQIQGHNKILSKVKNALE